MRECSLVVIFEVCALYTAVLLGQIEDVCAWCLHSAHVGYTHTHGDTNTHTHTCAHSDRLSCSLVLNGSFVVLIIRKRKGNITADGVCVSVTLMSVSG